MKLRVLGWTAAWSDETFYVEEETQKCYIASGVTSKVFRCSIDTQEVIGSDSAFTIKRNATKNGGYDSDAWNTVASSN